MPNRESNLGFHALKPETLPTNPGRSYKRNQTTRILSEHVKLTFSLN